MGSFLDRFKRSWNIFKDRDPTEPEEAYDYYLPTGGMSYRPDRVRMSTNHLRTVVSSMYNRIAVDVSQININHVKIDAEGKFEEVINDELNYCFTSSANLDQTGRALIRDAVSSMFDEGCVAIVPTVFDKNPANNDSFKIYEMRVGQILEWKPRHIKVRLYNDLNGQKEDKWVEKRTTCILENPFYSIMNEPNSTAQRLIRVLNQIDQYNSKVTSGKLDLIIQLPYLLKSKTKQDQAEKRRSELESQLENSRLGIGYIDGTEKVIQLNRPLEDNLWQQALDLQQQLYGQLGFSESIFNGTADEKTMINYNNQIIEPILSEIAEESQRKWISKTAITQGQAIRFYRDPFKLVPVAQIAEIADKFTRNEVMTSNEIRAEIGQKPSKDPKADELRNSNLNHPDESGKTEVVKEEIDLNKTN